MKRPPIKKPFLALLLSLLLPLMLALMLALPVCANASSATTAQDDLLAQVLTTLTKNTQQHFRFVQEKQLAILKKPLITEGELQVAPDQTVTWDIQQPYQLRYILTQGEIREIDTQGERRQSISQNPVAAALTAAMTATFSGLWQQQATQAELQAHGTLDAWHLAITPTAEALKPLIAGIDVSGSQANINTVVIREANGDRTTIRLTPFLP